MQVLLVYVTCQNRGQAINIAQCVVGERLAACANVIDGVTSIYRWEGRVQEDGEAILLLKTHPDRLHGLTERIRELHSYECPCIVAYHGVGGNPDYERWILLETGQDDAKFA